MNQKKIAELAHVSLSTVSKALSGSTEVNPETAAEIRKIAIDIGYFKEKNKIKRDNNNNRSLHIAVIVPEITGFHYSSIINCLKNQIEKRDALLSLYIYDFDKNKADKILESIILQGAADGVIMFSEPNLPVKPNIPIVIFSSSANKIYDSIGQNVHALIDDAVKFLAKLGHKKIGFVGELHTLKTSNEFKLAMTNNNLPLNDRFVYIENGRFEAIGIEASKKILSQEDRPTAILAAYDEVAMSLIHELSQNGINVPDDISVMGINNISSSAYAQIPLTTVDTFSEEQYKTAVELLFDKIINETTAVKHITIQHKIVARKTTKPLKENTNE